MNDDIYNMNLHDFIEIKRQIMVTRVPGGWIYEITGTAEWPGGMVFVPFNNELQK